MANNKAYSRNAAQQPHGVDPSPNDASSSAPLSIRLSSELHEALGVLSMLTNKTKSELIREFIFEGMRNRIGEKHARSVAQDLERRWIEASDQIREKLGA